MIRHLRAMLAAGLMLLGSVPAFAAATLWNPYPAPIFAANGRIASGAKAYFYAAGTTTPLTVFSDNALAVPRTQPVVAGGNGVFPNIYLPYGNYRVRVTDASGVVISDSDGIANPAPPDSGGGGGIVVTADMVLSTGDVKWRMQSGTLAGFVRMNGRTIGSAASGAAERANADTATLYAYLWDTFPDTIATVSGGRGASAAADFAANKAIVVPSMQGRGQIGLDDMGGMAANIIQRSTTISTTNASPTATVASATGLAAGMYVVSANVPAGTTITAISGTTLTLSGNASGTASGTAARFSEFADAQTAGAAAGSATHVQIAGELASHTHTGTTDGDGQHSHSGSTSAENAGHAHSYTAPSGSNTFDRNLTGVTGTAITGSASAATGAQDQNHAHSFVTSANGLHTHAFTSNATGSGNAMGILNPSRAGTYYIKL